MTVQEPGLALPPVDARHFGLDEDETLLPETWSREVRRGRSLARQDLKKLLALPPAERIGRVERAESRRSFRSRALAELLLAESRRRAAADPAEAEHLGRLAQVVLHWTPGPPGERWRELVRARAAAHRANALRRAGRLEEADALFRDLHERVLRRDLESPALLAEVAGWEAALRWRQGRGGEAARLLGWAADAHRRAGSRPGLLRCLVRWSEVLRAQGEPEAAAGCLEWAAKLADVAVLAAERPAVLLRLGQALCDAGREEAARGCLEAAASEDDDGDADGRFDTTRGPLLAERTWLAGRVDGSPRRLSAARDALALAGRPGEAALASLDLAAVLLPHAAAGPLAKLRHGLGRLAAAEGLPPRVAEWVRLAADQLDPETPPPAIPGAEQHGVEPPPAGPPDADALSLLRRGLLRELALAEWGAD